MPTEASKPGASAHRATATPGEDVGSPPHRERVSQGPDELEEAMEGQGPQRHEAAPEETSAAAAGSRQDGSAPAVLSHRADRRAKERKARAAALIGAVVVTLVSVAFICSFMGALHKPGPRSVPLGIVGTSSQASALSAALGHQAPGGFTVASYPTQAAASSAITGRSID